jgi:pimeloyl-ACP methyl ester carboxylesterase
MQAVPLAWEELGEGAPWMFLHGFPLTRKLWDPQRALARDAHLVLPDLRGHGGSTVAKPASMEAMATDVLALCDHLGLERFGLLGLSMGGYVALALHRLAPTRVRALVLADTHARADTPEQAAGREGLARKLEANDDQVLLQEFLPKLLGPRGRADEDLVSDVRAMILSNEPDGLAAALRGMAERPDLREHLPSIACPTLVLVGEEDAVARPALARELAEAIPDARLQGIAGAGHLSSLEEPAAFNEAVGAFVRRTAVAPTHPS